MTKIKLTKEEADRLMKTKGNISGSVLKATHQFILDKKGKKGVEMLEKRLEELGYPPKLKEISSFKWYPYAYSILSVLVVMELLDWDESKAFEMGYAVPSYSTFAKLVMKYISVERMFEDAPKYWRKYFDFGEVKFTKIDKEKKLAVARLDNFRAPHLFEYELIRGSLTRHLEMVTKSKNVKLELTKCILKGDSYDEFKITW
jgi:hypothetical protein